MKPLDVYYTLHESIYYRVTIFHEVNSMPCTVWYENKIFIAIVNLNFFLFFFFFFFLFSVPMTETNLTNGLVGMTGKENRFYQQISRE